MQRLLLTLLSVLFVTLIATPTLGAGWLWDTGNGVGFVAFAGLLYLGRSEGSGKNQQAHQLLGFAVLGVTTTHAYWFLLFDAAVIEYIKPGAPVYMWAGILGFILLTVLIFTGLPEYRLRLHKRYAIFKYWHRGLAFATIAGAGYHIVASGFYLGISFQVLLFVMLIIAALFGDQLITRREVETRQPSAMYLVAGVLCVLLFAGIRNFSI